MSPSNVRATGTPQRLANVLLVLASILLCAVVAEGMIRTIDGHPLLATQLSDAVGEESVRPEDLDQVQLARGVKREWFFQDPPPLPNRRPPPPEWVQLYRSLQDQPSDDGKFQPTDVFKAWNSAFAGDPCTHGLLRHAPGQLFVYDPADGVGAPRFRFLPDASLPDGLVTNQIGWRGAPIQDPRGDKSVRIVFVGSSTVVDAHYLPFSHSEFVGHWLNLWAASQGSDVRFEVLNAGRESIMSNDIAAVVHNEVLPLRPDLVVYYEGGNQFSPASIVEKVPTGTAVRSVQAQRSASPSWLRAAARHSALMARIQAAIGLVASDLDGREWPKPDYRVVWPAGLDEFDPDLSYPRLPVNLNAIQRDLDRIRTDLASAGGELAISSFVWMVKDGMVLDPVRHRFTLEQLNVANYPFRYRELERLARFQNRVFREVCRSPWVAVRRCRAPAALQSRPVHGCAPFQLQWHPPARVGYLAGTPSHDREALDRGVMAKAGSGHGGFPASHLRAATHHLRLQAGWPASVTAAHGGPGRRFEETLQQRTAIIPLPLEAIISRFRFTPDDYILAPTDTHPNARAHRLIAAFILHEMKVP